VRAPGACSSGQKFPVVIDLHGNGGQGNLQRLGNEFDDNIVLVAPDGYERSWNIIKEASKAPDVDFIIKLIAEVGMRYPQADMTDVTIVGTSNGAGLINRLLIEAPSPRPFHRVVPMVSMLGKWQYHDNEFYKLDNTTQTYHQAIVPDKQAPEFIYLHGTEDGAVPYDGGIGVLGLEFWDAQGATFIWAQQWGEKGSKLADGDGVETSSGIFKYSYLGGSVVHYKVVGAGHALLNSDQGAEVMEIVKKAVLGL